MRFSRHITRNYDNNRTHRIRYDEDDFICRIYRFDKTKETQYSAFNESVTIFHSDYANWRGMRVVKKPKLKGLTSANQKKNLTEDLNPTFSVEVEYEANETSDNYRLECLYANSYVNPVESDEKNKGLTVKADIYVDGVKQDVGNGSTWNSTDVNFNRHHQYVSLRKGKHKIRYEFTNNAIFIALSVKKFEVYESRRDKYDENDNLTLIKATIEHTDELDINTMSAEFMYYHDFDEKLLPTDKNANRSGLIFDYRDEINLWVKDTTGTFQQVFGGYISTVEVDDDLTKMTMQCADRLIDMDRRYNISEIQLKQEDRTDNDPSYKYGIDFLKNYNYYSSALKFLLRNTELPVRTNVKTGDPLVMRKNWKLVTYKKGATEKLATSNATATPYKNSMTLRNGDDTLKAQSITIYNNKSRSVCLNDYPNMYFHYGLGTHEWTEEYDVVTSTAKEVMKPTTKTQKKWLDRANSLTKATEPNKIIYDIWKGVANRTTWVNKKDFYQSAETTWNKKKGNCCCTTELMLKLLEAKGITNLKYCHIKKGDRGHVFAKVNGFYVDPTTSSKSRGWHNHIVYPKGATLRKVTDYPTKPFGN